MSHAIGLTEQLALEVEFPLHISASGKLVPKCPQKLHDLGQTVPLTLTGTKENSKVPENKTIMPWKTATR